MTDEEKKAIENLKGTYWYVGEERLEENIKVVLNLIEKQQKEIEDNKKYIDLHYVPYEQYTSKLNELNKKWKDKIKAILEEYKYTEIGDSEKIIEFYKKMQSLLEKEE